MASIGEVEDCELCAEVELAGTAATGWRGFASSANGPFSRLIRRTSVLDVISGLGCLLPGYLLLVPRRHVNSSGELSEEEMNHFWSVAWKMADQIRRQFGHQVVAVEHGSSGDAEVHGRACISHAHVHLFPISAYATPQVFAPRGSSYTSDLNELRRLSQQRRNYYYCAWQEGNGLLVADPELQSQHARRIWAASLERRDEWDWAAFPFRENCRATTRMLRRDVLTAAPLCTTDSDLAETLATYQAVAGWYARRTRDFPSNSTLRAEIAALAANSCGQILDAGAGAGRDAAEFAEHGRAVTALDASSNLLDYVPQRSGITTAVGDVRKLPMADCSMGAVWCSAVLLHLERQDVIRALREFSRVLAGGGLAQISVKEGHGKVTETLSGSGLRRHFTFYNTNDLKSFANKVGLSVERTWTEEEEADDGRSKQRWAKALLRKTD